MKRKYTVAACGGLCIDVKRGQTVTVYDTEGGQAVDFFGGNRRRRLTHPIPLCRGFALSARWQTAL